MSCHRLNTSLTNYSIRSDQTKILFSTISLNSLNGTLNRLWTLLISCQHMDPNNRTINFILEWPVGCEIEYGIPIYCIMFEGDPYGTVTWNSEIIVLSAANTSYHYNKNPYTGIFSLTVTINVSSETFWNKDYPLFIQLYLQDSTATTNL